MNSKLVALTHRVRPFLAGVVVLGAITIASMPAANSAPNTPVPAPTPAPPGATGSPIAVTPAFAQTLAAWQVPGLPATPPPPTGNSDAWYQDCHSGNVNPADTGGWCWASELNLFYNLQSKTFLDPFSNRLMLLNATHDGLIQVIRTDDDNFQPPAFVSPGVTPPPLSTKCTPEQHQLAGKHVGGLHANAAHADSPAMQALFTSEAQWWQQLCQP